MTLVLVCTIFAYAGIMFIQLINKTNPNINEQTILNFYSAYDKVKVNDINY